MKVRTRILTTLCTALVLQTLVLGAEYFVNKDGADANNGTSRETAFLTVQKGVDALSPGDTLTIGPGEYFEAVERSNFGGPDADTVIRAEIPGTAVMRGDVDAPEFEKVEGTRFVYAAPFDQTPLAVLEHDTLTIFPKRPNVLDVEYEPGTFYYDEAEKKLYMSSSDLRAPDGRRYSVAVTGRHGFELTPPERVVIDGLVACGFYPGWGIVLNKAQSCIVRNCRWYLCEGGLCMESGGADTVIENCDSYAHSFGGIVLYSAKDDIIRNCRTYLTQRRADDEYFGIMHYHSMPGTLLIQNCISWGQKFDFSVKPSQNERLENCVALGSVRNAKMFHNIIGGGNEYDRDSLKGSPDNILFLREKNLDKDFEFADPLNLDFRLQPDSRFRGAAPDQSDCGPYPYEENVFYVSPEGNDMADGLSMRKPWQTLAHAFENLRPGDTLYLAEGQYEAAPLNDKGDGKSPIAIRGRGYGTVVVTGTLNVANGAGIAFERLDFSGGAVLSDGRDLRFENCTFFGDMTGLNAGGIEGLDVAHCLFMGLPLRAANSQGLTLSGNIHANVGEPAVILDTLDGVRYSDYNSYADAAHTWQVAGAVVSLDDLRQNHDRYSRTATPRVMPEKGAPRLGNAEVFDGRGPASTAMGTHRDYDAIPKSLELVGPFVHSVSDTTANIEWWVSKPATFELAWGDTPEMTNKVENLKFPDSFTTYSLTGLDPGKKYYFAIRSADTSGRGEAVFSTVLKPEMEPLSFTTMAAAPKAAVYYVAPDGDDANTGLSREQAWRTVRHASDSVNAGDTVMITGGNYTEDVRIRATGDEGKPIVFRSAPGEKVVFVGSGLPYAFEVVAKKNVYFDGLYFIGFGDSMGGVFSLWQGDSVQITRCFNVQGTGNVALIDAKYSADVLVKNCVSANGFSIARFHVSPRCRMENNLFLRPWISALTFVNKPGQKGFFRKNIITDNLGRKVHAGLLTIGRFESFVEEDNCYFLRVPDEQRKLFFFYGTAAYGRYDNYGITTDFATPPVIADNPDGTENNPRMSLKEYQAMVGDTGSYVGDPKLAGTRNMGEGRGMPFERVMSKGDIDFPDLFATDPKAVEMDVGLQREAFKDFWFNKD